ncbi:MAG: hypothetical protein N2035_02575 [Chthoniobacterales bacterium]|nr:hypothetical protein [Chthoniobacterales bacterium]
MEHLNEEIWTVPSQLLDRIGPFQGICLTPQLYLPELLNPQNAKFLPRFVAENDPTYKQLIPYCIFTFEDKVLRYFRGSSGAESRLHRLASIGIGGHINRSDLQDNLPDKITYYRALYRELNEEISTPNSFASEKIIALINDDSNPVGQVHLGIVHKFSLNSPKVSSREADLINPQFLTPQQILHDPYPLESWSQILLQNWHSIN